MERYSIIPYKNKREIVLLRGSGCVYKKCSFCDYYTDSSESKEENYLLNKSVLERVTGQYGRLEVINSGSVFELDEKTLRLIKKICREKGISILHFESHYLYKDRIKRLREDFCGLELKMKLGLESFDYDLREKILHKGIDEKVPAVIAEYFDEANFLFGLSGQTADSMKHDIELGLRNFERICVNIMCENTASISPNKAVIDSFIKQIYPIYKDNDRVDILINNTDFGVGD